MSVQQLGVPAPINGKNALASGFEPKIIAFLCNWCAYAGADKAGTAQVPFAPNVREIRVMCSGRVDPQFILSSFEGGADGVLVLGCHPGDCHYKEQNYRAIQRHVLVARLLEQFGISAKRCRFDYVSAAEGERFAKLITEMTETIRELGPLQKQPTAGGASF
ncbi:MAG TPA: hydrogenase iron-sulfur subunit [Planctomycetota bacterium]|jgi:F420-non-reducing hydrogenase iron-sulfur subunit